MAKTSFHIDFEEELRKIKRKIDVETGRAKKKRLTIAYEDLVETLIA